MRIRSLVMFAPFLLPLALGACGASKPSSPMSATTPPATQGRVAAVRPATLQAVRPAFSPPTAMPAATATAAVAADAEEARTETKMEREAPPPPPSTIAIVGGELQSVRAGEWDDNANYREFEKWIAGEPVSFHNVDVSDRRFLVVRDSEGHGVPRCRVVVNDDDKRQATLTTVASGHAILFPRAEGLRGDHLVATATCDGNTASRASFSLADADDGVVTLDLATKRALPATRAIDVGFILDTTGSMSEEISSVKATIEKVTASLGDEKVNVRVGMVAFKDRGDEYVTKTFALTTDTLGFEHQVEDIFASGGGDTAESVNAGVHAAVTGLDWSEGAVARFAFLVGDAPPHLDYEQDADYATDMKDAAHRGIQLFTIAASGMDEQGQVVWRQIAQYTGATNMFVLRGGAGPQSTGAGDPKSSCGGTHENYASGNLDELIVGKIRHEIHGLDRDPLKIAGLGQDEDAKPCQDRLMAVD
jgi:hypothetical protein